MPEEQIVTFHSDGSSELFSLVGATILVDEDDFKGIHHAARNLAEDFSRVTKGPVSPFQTVVKQQADPLELESSNAIIIGCIESCWMIKQLEESGRIDTGAICGKWESFTTRVVDNPLNGCEKALVIAGSDKRGAIFGAYTLSRQIGVSPWYWWADVPPQFYEEIFAHPIQTTQGEPSIQYRGIFINDEAPALTGWVLEKFGGYNSNFYKKVYELLLRLKANFMWPAMWPGYPNPGAIFFVDDPENQRLADEYGICVSTSHHEPMQRATTEWFHEGHEDGSWDWTTHRDQIIDFFRKGVQRAIGLESFFTMGIRGEYDKGMTTSDPGAVVRDVLQQQRALFKEIHGREDAVPQVLALYKEVQDLYQAGEFTVPDDVTLLFADDNFGALRRLPSGLEKTRAGGAGIYYHFEYVGAPRSYKWINPNSLGKIYHQLHQAHERNAKKIWVFNVGDIKPMEVPLTFAMSMAWNIDSVQCDSISKFLFTLSTECFPQTDGWEIARIWQEYDRLVRMRRHEHIEPDTFSLLHYGEADGVESEWQMLETLTEEIYEAIPGHQKPAFWQLVVHPVKASSIFTRLRIAQARNQLYARQRRNSANKLLRDVLDLFDADFKLSQEFHTLLDGKWNHIMCQPHMGYGDTWHAPSRDAIFGLAYVQRGQESNAIMGHMGVAVEGHEGIRAGRINEESERTHPSRRDLVAGLTLPPLSLYNNHDSRIEIFNRGTKRIHWKCSTSYPWILLRPSYGVLGPDDYDASIRVSVLWQDVPTDFDQTVTINILSKEGDFEQVHLPIKGHRVPKSFSGFIEKQGYVSIPAVGMGIEEPYKHHPELGRGPNGSVTLRASVSNDETVPFLKYPIYIFSRTAPATVTLYFNLTLEIDPTHRISYDIGVDNQPTTSHYLLALPDKESKVPAEGWLEAVKDCVWKRTHKIDCLESGEHLLRVRLKHSNLLLEKIVVDLGGVKECYLGPPPSFHVGEMELDNPEAE
ncbi:hypothetical protein N7532_007369 [Penicillium argentinense]|uniref:Gylcosyl hydrolase 115 C-terminal domain-containing protein n=1 Tax=Penicillium argentinense TaxID=1131581 RepID=A0A9W9F7M4_9EURO|nr:uncharacterized protein N7532_007369 [Penicillium argentinense]KAJ5095078.1 hypothetical protein N7532_007369 [Penicillium argentinense]